MSLTKAQRDRLAKADEIIQQAKSSSQQPRFDAVDSNVFMATTTRWAKDMLEQAPSYDTDSRKRSSWLDKFWKNEPYLSGVINSVVQIDKNRGWSLVGGRNQVLRFQHVLHNWQIQPGMASWRDGCGAASLAFNTQDIGALVEIGRQFRNGPMAGLYSIDPTKSQLTGQVDLPLRYWPAKISRQSSKPVDFLPTDYMRMASMPSIDESFNGLGYCALSRCIDLAIIMIAVWRHEQEQLFARAPKGLLLLQHIDEGQWNKAMKSGEAALDTKEQDWYGAVSVIAGGGDNEINAKLVSLSNLPAGFDQEKFTNLMLYGYALAFGYDAREFWPVSQGSLGSGNETEVQHRSATGKGGKEYWQSLQEGVQNQLPPTLHFSPDERDANAELSDALLAKAQAEVVVAMYESGAQKVAGEGIITQPEARELLAEKGLIPRDWTQAEEDAEGSDQGDVQQRVLEYPEVQRAIQSYQDEPIVQYSWPANRVRVLYQRGSDALSRHTFIMGNGSSITFQGKKEKYFSILQAKGDLYESKDLTITQPDVDAAIEAANRRVGAEFAAMLQAKNIKSKKSKSKQGRFSDLFGRKPNARK
jgi:hypothetical protein